MNESQPPQPIDAKPLPPRPFFALLHLGSSTWLAIGVVAIGLGLANLYAERSDGTWYAHTFDWRSGWPLVFLSTWRHAHSATWSDPRPWRGEIVEWDWPAAAIDGAVALAILVAVGLLWQLALRLGYLRPPRRRSGWFVLTLTTMIALFLNFPGDHSNSDHPKIDHRCRHGWPYTYLERGGMAEWSKVTQPSDWTPYVEVAQFNFAGFIGNLVVVLVLAVGCFRLWEWRRAKRAGWLQFSIADLGIITLAIAAAMAWITFHRGQRANEQRIAKKMSEDSVIAVMAPPSPTWLAGLLGEQWAGKVLGPSPAYRLGGKVHATISADALKPAEALTQLRTIDFAIGPFDGAGLAHLRCQATLKSVALFVKSIDDESLRFLRGASRLEALHIFSPPITDRGMEELSGCAQLKILAITGARIGDAEVRWLSNLQRLQSLTLNDTLVGDDCLQVIGRMSALVALQLNGAQLSDAGLKHLRGLRKLRFLELRGASVTDEGLEVLQDMKFLAHLDLRNTGITDEAIKHFEALPRLTSVSLEQTRVSPKILAHYQLTKPNNIFEQD